MYLFILADVFSREYQTQQASSWKDGNREEGYIRSWYWGIKVDLLGGEKMGEYQEERDLYQLFHH